VITIKRRSCRNVHARFKTRRDEGEGQRGGPLEGYHALAMLRETKEDPLTLGSCIIAAAGKVSRVVYAGLSSREGRGELSAPGGEDLVAVDTREHGQDWPRALRAAGPLTFGDSDAGRLTKTLHRRGPTYETKDSIGSY